MMHHEFQLHMLLELRIHSLSYERDKVAKECPGFPLHYG
jgi:hypothetical protein